MHAEFSAGSGVEYRGHRFLRTNTRYVAFDVLRGSQVIDRILPRHFASARSLGEYLDRMTGAEIAEYPPVFRQAERQDVPRQ